jgi:hypothetical protein
MRIKDWLPPMLRTWASQKKRAMNGRKRFADGSVHEDGWSAISVAAFMNEGRSTGGSGPRGQRFEEVFSGDGLVIWRALADAPLDVREVLLAHYVVSGNVKRKAREMRISESAYWHRLDLAYYWLAGAIEGSQRVS